MKSIKTNPNSAKGPDKGKIVKQIVLHIIDNTRVSWFNKNFLENNRYEVH